MNAVDIAKDVGYAAAKVAPTATVAAATTLKAIDPQWFVVIPAGLLALAQLCHLLWKWRREARGK